MGHYDGCRDGYCGCGQALDEIGNCLMGYRCSLLDRYKHPTHEMIPEWQMQEAFKETNFGSSKPREIVAETLLKIAGEFSPGHTALVCCQELGLIGKNKHEPRLTKKGRKYLYAAWKGRK